MKGPFAFLIHPLKYDDVIRVLPELANKRPEFVEDLLAAAEPFVAAEMEITSLTGDTAAGFFIVVPLTARRFVTNEQLALKKVLAAGKLAVKLGARILGLGGFTSVVGRSGLQVVQHLNGRIAVTSGAAYTIYSTVEVLERILAEQNRPPTTLTCAVIGATGAIGRALAFILAKRFKRLLLVARNHTRLQNLQRQLKEFHPAGNFEITTGVKGAILQSQVVICATSSPYELIHPGDLQPNAIVCDTSMPHNTSKQVLRLRPDVTVIEGGIVKLPSKPRFKRLFNNTSFEILIGYPNGNVLACMAETIILALEEMYLNYSIGRNISYERVFEIAKLARKHGFEVTQRLLMS